MHVSLGDEAFDVTNENGGGLLVDESVYEAIMPNFIKRFLYIHKNGCREAFHIFGMHGCLSVFENFVS